MTFKAFVFAAALFAAHSAGATTITFDNLAGTPVAGYGGTYTPTNYKYTYFDAGSSALVNGFKFTSNQYEYFMQSGYSGGGDASYYAYNGTDLLMTSGVITMTSATNSPFSVNSLDLKDWGNSISSVVLTGTFIDNSTIVKYITLDSVTNNTKQAGNDLVKYLLTGFSGLKSFNIASGEYYYMVIDNIEVNATAVPEPGTLATFGLGLAAVAMLRRRRQN